MTIQSLFKCLTTIISETNGITLGETIELAIKSPQIDKGMREEFRQFLSLLYLYQQDKTHICDLIEHKVGKALYKYFKNFPLKYREEHIHLTGSLSADFIYPRLEKLIKKDKTGTYLKKIQDIYGKDMGLPQSVGDVNDLIRLRPTEKFDRYLEILMPAKFVLVNRKAHEEAAFHMATELYEKYNIGSIRLKFTLSRASTNDMEQVPGTANVTEEDVVLGLYEGFKRFQELHPDFIFYLSPSFRKESEHYDGARFESKHDHFNSQVRELLGIIKKHPQLKNHLEEVDTVGNEKNLYRKHHFKEMQMGFRKLQYNGFRIRSHHGETWYTLKKGVQAVDNAMNIWRIDALEHGLSLGINPNYYFHSLYQYVFKLNQERTPLPENTQEYRELEEMNWRDREDIFDKIKKGEPLTEDERIRFVKIKFHTAREVERYQHDVLNRMLQKEMTLIALPTSNQKLTGSMKEYKDHPFSWWEKKGVSLGIGTDNYITLNTDYIRELLIILFTDFDKLKITKLLMVATGENRRPLLSKMLWDMRKRLSEK